MAAKTYDLARERGDLEKAAAMQKMCDECGFELISMQDDFETIYGGDVEVVPYERLEVEEAPEAALEPAA